MLKVPDWLSKIFNDEGLTEIALSYIGLGLGLMGTDEANDRV